MTDDATFALKTNPGPWKVRTRKAGERMRAQFPWEVVDATGGRVALVPSGQVGCLLVRGMRAEAGQ